MELAGEGAGVPDRTTRISGGTPTRPSWSAGLDIHVAQRLLGHPHIASTVGYTHLALGDLEPRLDRIWTA